MTCKRCKSEILTSNDGVYCGLCNFTRNDMTKQEVETRMLAVAWHQAALDGKPFEVECNDGGNWETSVTPVFLPQVKYRRKPELKIKPWTFEDMAQYGNAWFRKTDDAFRITSVGEHHVKLGNKYCTDYISLLREWQYSTDLKMWYPCGKAGE
jgi:hypothetical protein